MDVYYYPGWLTNIFEVFEPFQKQVPLPDCLAGRLALVYKYDPPTGKPARYEGREGHLIPMNGSDHAHSLGKTQETIADEFCLNDYRISRKAYPRLPRHPLPVYGSSGCGQTIPALPKRTPDGDSVAHFDRAIDGNHLLRLATSERVTLHMGNQLSEQVIALIPPGFQQLTDLASFLSKRNLQALPINSWIWKPVRKLLLAFYDRIFRLYYG